MSTAKIRKIVTTVESTYLEMGQTIDPPTRRAASVAVIENPFAGEYVENLEALSPEADLLAMIDESNDEDCDRLIETTEQIGDRIEEGEDGLRHIFEVMVSLIEKYEDEHFTLPSKVTPESMMIHLMEKNSHNQSDMQDVAPRPVINMIVNGKRKLTREHIEKLCR